MSIWPNFFIAGAPRCGTSSLHSWLQAIPGIYMSRIKEPNFFSRAVIADDHPLIKPIRDEDEYLALFAGAETAPVRGEASPNYLEDPEAPFHIARRSPGAKVLVSLRDPVERLYSHYLMLRNNRPALGSFMEEIERGLAQQENPRLAVLVPGTGLYAAHVSRYHEVFGTSRFKVLIFEEVMADVPGAIRDILAFLGIEHQIDEFAKPAQRQYSEVRGPLVRYLFGNRRISRFFEASVPYGVRKYVRNALLVKQAPKPRMDPKARECLVRYYRDDVRRLEALLGRRLPWRNFAETQQ
jgi:hypothetical protein